MANRTLEPLKSCFAMAECGAFSIKAQTLSKLQRLRCVPALILVRVKANGGNPGYSFTSLALSTYSQLASASWSWLL